MHPTSVALLVSIVTYAPDRVWLDRTLASLALALDSALRSAALQSATVVIVSNDDTPANELDAMLQAALAQCEGVRHAVISGHGNIGYGAANHLAIASTEASRAHDVLLVLNPDVEMSERALCHGLTHLATHHDCALVTPVARDAGGAPLYLAKRYPSVGVLALRGLAPGFVRRLFATKLARYERRDLPFDAECTDLAIVSGCFMLMPMRVYRAVGGFDPGYFLYFEDFDLSLRARAHGRITRLSSCEIVHAGGNAARKGLRHRWHFVQSAWRFFVKHGWSEKTAIG